MKKFIFALLSVIVTFALNAKEPGNNLGKSLSTMRVLFPDLQYGWTEDGKDYYVQFDNDGYHKMTYYFVIQNNRVASESLILEVAGFGAMSIRAFFMSPVYSMRSIR